MKKTFGLVKAFGTGLSERKLPLYASSGTYNIFMAVAPVIMLVVSLVQFLPITSEDIMLELANWLPEQVLSVVGRIVDGIYAGGKAAFTVSIVLTAFSASAAMRAVMKGIDAAYDVKSAQNIILFYARSVLYMLVFVVILLVSFVIMAYGGGIMELLQGIFPDVAFLTPLFAVLKYARYVIVMLFLFFIFLLMYRVLPRRKLRLRDQIPGALFSSLAWVVFSMVFSFYISFSDKFGAYGAIGTVMVAMMWLYYSIFFVLIGGWLNRFLTLRREAGNPAEDGEAAIANGKQT